jgi:site-specific DNA-methyltransferase (adenine-specific)
MTLTTYNEDCLITMQKMENNSIDCILSDPPYLYLKNQRLDKPFDEILFFSEVKRILKPTGFIVLFGRGTSFYRWNTRLADLGFTFKEEIIWDKRLVSSPVLPISRVHETISIYTKGRGTINKIKVPYLEIKALDYSSIAQDVKRLIGALNNEKALAALQEFCEDYKVKYTDDFKEGHHVTYTKNTVKRPKNHAVNTLAAIINGMTEKSIIPIVRDHYATIHPTQKPVRLLERLLALVTKEGDTIFDSFAGSFSTAAACRNTNRDFIGCEIDSEYYAAGLKRLGLDLS